MEARRVRLSVRVSYSCQARQPRVFHDGTDGMTVSGGVAVGGIPGPMGGGGNQHPTDDGIPYQPDRYRAVRARATGFPGLFGGASRAR